MFRKAAWLAACGLLVGGASAFAQGPAGAPSNFGYPGSFGYPGYPGGPGYDSMQPAPTGNPAPGYNPAASGMGPNIPYGYGVPGAFLPPMPPNAGPAPGGPFVNPMPTAPMPPAPGGPFYNSAPTGPMPAAPGVRTLPNYDGYGPKQGASEPYVVPREAPPPAPNPVNPPAPPAAPGQVPAYVMPTGIVPAGYVQAVPPSEPYALYEGPRSAAEVKVEQTRVWVQASYIHWWIRGGNTPPLVTTGSLNDTSPGALGQPGTSVVLGGGSLGPTEFSGIQASVGMWLDPEKSQAFELAGFYVGKNSRQYGISSDAGGSPLLGQPVIATGAGGGEAALFFSQPGVFAGSIRVSNEVNFYGTEANYIINAYRINGWTFDYFAGVRFLYLDDNLSINQNITVLPGGAGFIPFNGVVQPAGANFLFRDVFDATNRFYGGQIGARVSWTSCNWELGAVMKLGLGATTHTVAIDGSTTLNVNGTTTTVSGSSLAQASNIGQHNSTDFSVVPELDLTVGYQFTRNFRVFAGYNLLYWTNVERAGNQIDRQIDFTQVPTSGTYVPGTTGSNPRFLNSRSDFWAQGLNVGMEFTF